jgi:hypothetical protein
VITRRAALAGGVAAGLSTSTAAWGSTSELERSDATVPFSGAQALKRAEQAIGQRTMYAMGPDTPVGGPWRRANDCSGLILWCFGFNRERFDGEGSTNAIYADIMSRTGEFVRTLGPRVGGIVIYPNFKLPGGSEDSGHIALIKSVTRKDSCSGAPLWKPGDAGGVAEELPFEAYDCSSTSWWTFGDAVRVSDYLKFLLHDQLMVLAAEAGAKAADVRRPVYAVLKGEENLPIVQPHKAGHCPGR